jgi:hypothetical protein
LVFGFDFWFVFLSLWLLLWLPSQALS